MTALNSFSPNLSTLQILAMLSARRKLILGLIATILVFTLALSLLIPKTWVASSDVYIDYRDNDRLGGQKLSAMLDDSYMQTQLDLLRSQRVASMVIDALHLRDTPIYVHTIAESGQEKADQTLIQSILDNTSLKHARGSRIVTVEFRGSTPEQAKNYSNAIVKNYMQLGERITSDSARSRFEQYNTQLTQLRNEVDNIQNTLTHYQQENDILNVQEYGDQEAQAINTLNNTLVTLQIRLQEAQSQQKASKKLLKSGLSQSELPLVSQVPIIHTLKSQLSNVDRQIGDVKGNLGPRHLTLLSLNAEREKILARIEREAHALVIGVQGDIDSLSQQINQLSAEIAQLRSTALEKMQHRNQIAAYQRQLGSAQQVYSTALNKYDELALASNFLSPNVNILRLAELPTSPTNASLRINLMLGLLLGSIAAIFIALLLELLHRRIHSAEDLQYDADLPLLGQIGY